MPAIPRLIVALIMTVACMLNAEERQVFRVFLSTRGKVVHQWAGEHVVFKADEGDHPGKFNPETAPYLNRPMDTFNVRGITTIVIPKAHQVGGNVAGNIMVAWAICNAPGHTQFVKPTEVASDENLEKRLLPFLKGIPAVAEYLTGTHSKRSIQCTNMRIDGGYASAPATLKSWPRPYEFVDEADDCDEAGSGDTVQLVTDRTTTFRDRAKVVIWGTPKFRTGPVWKEWELCAVRCEWWLPCPRCGEYQILDFHAGMRYPANTEPTEIASLNLAWFECRANGCRIDNSSLRAMNLRGRWVSNHQTVDRDGNVLGTDPPTDRIGFRIPALISPFTTWGKIAAQYLRALGDPGKMMVFDNQCLARPFEQRTAVAVAAELERKIVGSGPPGIVPPWACMLLATADTQKDHFWYTVRAWGLERRSRLIAHGKVGEFDELWRVALDAYYPTAGGLQVPVSFLGIDSGGGLTDLGTSRTEEVYQACERDVERIIAYKGSNSRNGPPQWQSRIRLRDGKYDLVQFRRHQPDWWKNILFRFMNAVGDSSPWELNDKVDPEYVRHMCAEHRVLVTGKGYETWRQIVDGNRNDYWDCEALQFALAEYAGVRHLTASDQFGALEAAKTEEPDVVAPGDEWSIFGGDWWAGRA